MLNCTQRDVPIKDLLVEGADLIAIGSKKPAEESFVQMTDSPEALGIALGAEFPEFNAPN